MRYLLDVNVLIALMFEEHDFHRKASAWFKQAPDRLWATCPLTQAGFLRAAAQIGFGLPDAIPRAVLVLEQNCKVPDHEFWPVDVDLCDLSDPLRSRLRGRNQIADLQLLMLAHRHGGQLVTFDTGLRELASQTRYSSALLLL